MKVEKTPVIAVHDQNVTFNLYYLSREKFRYVKFIDENYICDLGKLIKRLFRGGYSSLRDQNLDKKPLFFLLYKSFPTIKKRQTFIKYFRVWNVFFMGFKPDSFCFAQQRTCLNSYSIEHGFLSQPSYSTLQIVNSFVFPSVARSKET